MKSFVVLLLFLVFAIVLGILSYVLKNKHTSFPDFRVGYHHKKIMESKEIWEYANTIAGNLCAIFSALGIALSLILFLCPVNTGTEVMIFFVYALLSIAAILILPVQFSKKR